MADGDVRDLGVRKMVSVMDRAELEDKQLRLMEENLLLKKHARSQEGKIKKMATKLLRLTADEKREAKRDGQIHPHNLEQEEVIEELQGRNRDLERHNGTLKSKVVLLKQQLDSRGKRHTPYDRIPPRISTGLSLSKRGQKAQSTEDVSIRRQSTGAQAAVPTTPRYGHSLLEDARRDNQELEELVLQLKQEVALLSAEADRNREELRLQEAQFEEDKLKLQERLQVQLTAVQKSNIQEDVELIKLQRELREKSSRLLSLQSQYLTLEKNLEVMKVSHAKVLQEMDALNRQLKEEKRRSSSLQSELQVSAVSQRAVSELQEMVSDLRSEKELLKQANDRLMKNAMDTAQEQEHRSQLKSLQDTLRQLEACNKVELEEKARVFEKLTGERELSDRLDQELKGLKTTYHQLREEHKQLQEKMKFFSEESSMDWGEVEEALVLVREGKTRKGRGVGVELEPLSFLEKVDNDDGDKVKVHQRELQELRAAHADTISELEKTRKLLTLQQTINKDCRREVDSLNSRLTDHSREQTGRLQEYAQLLDIKSARIKKLESQLRDIAYGTRQYKLDTTKFEFGSEEEADGAGVVELERGQNLLQFHITQVLLSSEALSFLNTSSPALFVSFGLQDFELQVTPVVQGARPLFGFTSNFVVTVTDVFLHHLQKGGVNVELHQAFGMKYKTLAAGSVRCRELITSAGGKVHGKVVLTGVDCLQECVNVGSLEYWMRLKLPVTQAIRLYQERSKALSFIDPSPSPLPPSTSESANTEPIARGADYNELTVSVVGCSGLKPHGQSHTPSPSDHTPSPYVMYKFYTFPDHDTPVVSQSSSPGFNDIKTFPLSMDQHLDHYLKTELLDVYVFDDLDPTETNYLGASQLPLLPLAEDKPISMTLQLIHSSGEPAGDLEISMNWKLPYRARITSPPPPSLPPSQSLLHSPPYTPSQEHKAEGLKSDVTQTVAKAAKNAAGIQERPRTDRSQPNFQRIQLQSSLLEEGGSSYSDLTTEESEKAAIQPQKEPVVALPVVVNADGATKHETVPLKTPDGSFRQVLSLQPAVETSGMPSPLPPLRSKPPGLPALVIPDRAGEKSVLETESEFSDITPLSSLGAPTCTSDFSPDVQPLLAPVLPTGVRLPHRQLGGSRGEISLAPGSQEDDYTESVSVSERSEVEEEIEEDLSEEQDTMFEETLTQPDETNDVSPLSLHSSDELPHPSPFPRSQPHVLVVKERGEGTDSPDLTPSPLESDNGKPVTSYSASTGDKQAGFSPQGAATMVITIVNFTLTPDSALSDDPDITRLFVEYQFLNFDYGELETESQPKPAPGEPAILNYRKVFRLDGEQKALLAAMLQPGDLSEGRLQFTVVSDPEDSEADCIEVGTAEVDLSTILQKGDLINQSIEVLKEDGGDPDVVGHLVISVEAADVFQQLLRR